jgi:trans-aconitate methyltransferase
MTARWLADQGFQVDAVEMDPARFRTLAASWQHGNPKPYHADIAHFEMSREHYSLVIAQATLHFLTPSQLNRLAPRIIAALRPGGYLVAEVLTTDDPEHQTLREEGASEVEPHTFLPSQAGALIHFFEPEELLQLFSALDLREYDLSRRIAPASKAGYRSGASLVACKPGPD